MGNDDADNPYEYMDFEDVPPDEGSGALWLEDRKKQEREFDKFLIEKSKADNTTKLNQEPENKSYSDPRPKISLGDVAFFLLLLFVAIAVIQTCVAGFKRF